MKIKGMKPEALEMVINNYYNQHKEILDIWIELLIAKQTDIEVQTNEEIIENLEILTIPLHSQNITTQTISHKQRIEKIRNEN